MELREQKLGLSGMMMTRLRITASFSPAMTRIRWRPLSTLTKVAFPLVPVCVHTRAISYHHRDGSYWRCLPTDSQLILARKTGIPGWFPLVTISQSRGKEGDTESWTVTSFPVTIGVSPMKLSWGLGDSTVSGRSHICQWQDICDITYVKINNLRSLMTAVSTVA